MTSTSPAVVAAGSLVLVLVLFAAYVGAARRFLRRLESHHEHLFAELGRPGLLMNRSQSLAVFKFLLIRRGELAHDPTATRQAHALFFLLALVVLSFILCAAALAHTAHLPRYAR